MKEICGIPESKKQRRQRISREIGRKGKVGEEIVRMNYALRGYEVERTGRGSDFHVVKRDVLGRVIDSKDIEVKTGSVCSQRKWDNRACKITDTLRAIALFSGDSIIVPSCC